MTTQQPVSHPEVSHPEQPTQPATIVVTTEQAKTPGTKADDKAPTSRTRRRVQLPSPRVLAAAILVIAAVELLLWQVAGPMWAIIAHAILAVAVVAPIALLIWLRRRGVRKSTERSTTGGGSSPKGSPSGGKPGGSGKPGLLSRLWPGSRNKKAGSDGGKSGGSPSGKRSPFSWPWSGGKSKPSGKTGANPAGGKSPRSWNPFKGPGKSSPAGGGGGSPKGKDSKAPKAPKKKPSSWLPDLIKGVREGAKTTDKPKKTEQDKPKPEAKEEKPAPAPKQEAAPKEKPQQPDTEQLVKEAVMTAAAAKPAPAAAPTGGSTAVGDMNKIRAAADEFAAALKDYDPESMHQLVREMPGLGEALNAVQLGIRHVASRAESEWPVAGPVVEGLRTMASDIKAAAGTAEETRGTLRRENEVDIERGEAPRHGSIEVERKWNVS